MRRLTCVVLVLVSLAGCGSQTQEDSSSTPDPGAFDGLVFTRGDGSTYELHDVVAECLTSDEGKAVELVRLTSPADYRRTMRGDKLTEPFLYVEVIPGVTGTRKLPLRQRNYDDGPSDVVVFGMDPQDQNELSGDVEEATGELTIHDATCDPEPRLSFTIKATLGSEFGNLPTMHVAGGLSAAGH